MTNTQRMWMVRAGEWGFLFNEFKNKKIVAIGWDKAGSFMGIKNREEIKNILKKNYPDNKPQAINHWASQLYKFMYDFKVGDYVITYNSEERFYLVGEIIGDYEHNNSIKEYQNIRKVNWIGPVPRDSLSIATKNSLGATLTIFELSEEGKKDVLHALKMKEPDASVQVEEHEDMDIIKKDMKAKGMEFIKDKISQLGWDEMQELIAGLLRAMGYKTIVSQKGPDRGRDIIASPDGLGLEDPRIIVEVKHREGVIGSQEIRSFAGGLRPGNKGLYVSTGGFSKEAKYECDRSNIPITVIDLDRLVELIIQYYEKFDTESRTLVPLVKIYWPE